jgi:DNA-binding PadR family transcriptional regulator
MALRSSTKPEDHLPLPSQFYHVLIALGTEVRHGYGIIQAFEELTEGRETLLPGSLYATLARMTEQGMLESTEPPAESRSGGPKRSYYRATQLGRALARAESERLEWLVGLARDRFPGLGDGAAEAAS